MQAINCGCFEMLFDVLFNNRLLSLSLYHCGCFVSLTRTWVIGGEYQKYRHQRWLNASDCGRLGRQAADHPRSVLRVAKAAEMAAQAAKVLLEAKQQLRFQTVPELTI